MGGITCAFGMVIMEQMVFCAVQLAPLLEAPLLVSTEFKFEFNVALGPQ